MVFTTVCSASDNPPEWLNASAFCRRAAIPMSRLLKLAAIKQVEVRALPGETLKYRASDADAIRAQGQGTL